MFVAHIQIAGDVSGGNAVLTVVSDPRFEGLVTHCSGTVWGATAAENYLIEVGTRQSGQGVRNAGQTFFSDFALGQAQFDWDPPAIIDSSQVQVTYANTDGDTYHLAVFIYNFKIEASKKVPLNELLSSLPRSGSFPY